MSTIFISASHYKYVNSLKGYVCYFFVLLVINERYCVLVFEIEEILTYERVERYLPHPAQKRPIVLIGPPNIGRHELRVRLIESELDRFAAPVPHTSRLSRPGEQNGVDYHFLSISSFEDLRINGAFVECGLFERAWYGTSKEAIQEVINSGKVCILTMQPEVRCCASSMPSIIISLA